jgi:hypothetical protein
MVILLHVFSCAVEQLRLVADHQVIVEALARIVRLPLGPRPAQVDA